MTQEKKSPIFRAPLPEDDEMKVFAEYDKKVFARLSKAMNDMTNP